jgi:hypothetical protein
MKGLFPAKNGTAELLSVVTPNVKLAISSVNEAFGFDVH